MAEIAANYGVVGLTIWGVLMFGFTARHLIYKESVRWGRIVRYALVGGVCWPGLVLWLADRMSNEVLCGEDYGRSKR